MMSEPGPSLAVDGTLLLAADSYIADIPESLRDPYSQWAFEYVATAFCSNFELHYPQPKSGLTVPPSTLFGLWIDEGAIRRHAGVSLDEHRATVEQLVAPFVKKIQEDAPQIARWLSHQMTEEMAVFYLGGGNPEDELPGFAELLSPLFQETPGPIISEVHRLKAEGLLPRVFRDLAYKHGLSDLRIALAYAYQAYAKGVTYALGLSELPTKPIYRPHWLRESAIYAVQLVDDRVETRVPGGCFPWGIILSRVFDPVQPHEKIEPSRIRDVFTALRGYSNWDKNAWVFEVDWPDDSEEEEVIRRDLEKFALDGLVEAKVAPLYQHQAIERVMPVAREYASKKIGRVAYETIAPALLQDKRVRSGELWARRSFRVDTIWKAFVDPGIRDAVAEWKRQRRKGVQ